MCCCGIYLKYGINPDIAVFEKSIRNGYPMAVVLGKRSVMDAAQNSFISSTNWTERIGPAAALATIRKYRDNKVDERLIQMGGRVLGLWKEAADAAGLSIHTSGLPTLGRFEIDGNEPLVLRTLFTQMMFERGYLA